MSGQVELKGLAGRLRAKRSECCARQSVYLRTAAGRWWVLLFVHARSAHLSADRLALLLCKVVLCPC